MGIHIVIIRFECEDVPAFATNDLDTARQRAVNLSPADIERACELLSTDASILHCLSVVSFDEAGRPIAFEVVDLPSQVRDVYDAYPQTID